MCNYRKKNDLLHDVTIHSVTHFFILEPCVDVSSFFKHIYQENRKLVEAQGLHT